MPTHRKRPNLHNRLSSQRRAPHFNSNHIPHNPKFRHRLSRGMTEAVAKKEQTTSAPARPKLNEEQLTQQYGAKRVAKAKAELEAEFADKNAIKIDMKKKVIFQPQMDIEVDPRLNGQNGISSGNDGRGNVIINVGQNNNGAKNRAPAIAKERPVNPELMINWPGKHHLGPDIGYNVTAEKFAEHWIQGIHKEMVSSNAGLNKLTAHQKSHAKNIGPLKNFNAHLRKPINAARTVRENIRHPIGAWRKSTPYKMTTQMGLRKQRKKTDIQNQSLHTLGSHTVQLFQLAINDYKKIKLKNPPLARQFIQERFTKIIDDYETGKRALILRTSNSTKAKYPTGKYGVMGRRTSRRRDMLKPGSKTFGKY